SRSNAWHGDRSHHDLVSGSDDGVRLGAGHPPVPAIRPLRSALDLMKAEMTTAFIRAREIGLEVPYYVQPERQGGSWIGTLFNAATSVPRRQFATLLDGISFDIEEGDRVALIGRNGAGKTTLLRVLTGAFRPTRGQLEVNGTRQALLNLSLGCNPEGTLHENIYLRATAMGSPAAKVRTMVDSIL